MNKFLISALVTLMIFTLVACGNATSSPVSEQDTTEQDTTEQDTVEQDTVEQDTTELGMAVKAVLEDKEEVNISFWTGTGEANFPYLEAIVKEFQETYPNIKVDFSNQGPITELTEKLTQNIVSKTTPTLSNLNPTSFPEYIDSGAVVDLMPYYNHGEIGYSAEEKDSLFFAYIDEASSFGTEGTMYGFPTNKKTTDVFVYNKTYFDSKGWSAPNTWDEVVTYSKAIFEETGSAGFSYDTSSGDAAFKNFTTQWGSPYVTADGEIDIDNDATRQALEFYKENMDAGYFTLPSLMPSAGGNHSSNGFVMGECYMYVGPAAGVPYAVPNPENGHMDFELGIAPLPQKDASNKVAVSKGEDYCIFSNATEEERVAAWLLIKFLSNDEQNVEWLVNTGNLPVSKTMLEVPAYKEFLDMGADGSPAYYKAASVNAALEMQDYMTYDRIIPQTTELSTEAGNTWMSVMIGGADIETAIADAVAKIN